MGHCELYWNVNYEELGTDVFIEGMIKKPKQTKTKQENKRKQTENKQTNKQKRRKEKKHQIERDCLRPMPY